MDNRIGELAVQIKEIAGSKTNDDDDDIFKELEDDVPESQSELEIIDKIVYALSNQDIIKGKAILESVTMTEALEWWKLELTQKDNG